MIERLRVRIPAGTAEEFSSPGSTFCADFGIRSTPVLPQWHVKDPGQSNESAGGRLQLNTPACTVRMWLCIKMTWCMVVWGTQNAPRREQLHVAPAMPAL